MDKVNLKILTQAQYQFLASKNPDGFYDDRMRQQLYAIIDLLERAGKRCGKEENRLRQKFQNVEFGILLPANQKTTGTLKFKNNLCVNGVHEGDITSGGTLIINSQGTVYGNLTAAEVLCKGKLAGDVKAGAKLTVYSTGTVLGDVVAPSIQVAPGALFKGRCKLGNPSSGVQAIPKQDAPRKNALGRLFKTG